MKEEEENKNKEAGDAFQLLAAIVGIIAAIYAISLFI